jgi:hypothetical protein
MSNKSTIKCPNCKTEFDASDAFRAELEKELNAKAKDWQAKKEDEYRKEKEQALKDQKQMLEESLRKNISSDYETRLRALTEANNAGEEKLKIARQKELDFLKKEQSLKEKEAELEISLQKKLNEESALIAERIQKLEAEKSQMRMREFEKQIEDQKKLITEMQRKADQGSMQTQGEVAELVLEELLRTSFPFDLIEEVAKGVKGADCIQHVRNNLGQPCGKIIYESKRTKAFTHEWIDKLKADMRATQADIAVIVTEVLPKDMDHFGMKEGVWICKFNDIKPLAFLLRDGLVRIHTALASQDNKGDKMQLLYNYLTGNEFKQQIEAIVEGFVSLKDGITREKIQMEKIWKEREKQLEKVLLNTTHFYGSVKGIAGNSIADIKLLE